MLIDWKIIAMTAGALLLMSLGEQLFISFFEMVAGVDLIILGLEMIFK